MCEDKQFVENFKFLFLTNCHDFFESEYLCNFKITDYQQAQHNKEKFV